MLCARVRVSRQDQGSGMGTCQSLTVQSADDVAIRESSNGANLKSITSEVCPENSGMSDDGGSLPANQRLRPNGRERTEGPCVTFGDGRGVRGNAGARVPT
jgi:hypothetical protein